MKIGDVVSFQDKRWFVASTKPGRICVLRTWEGVETEVPEAFDQAKESGLRIIAEPSRWPFLTVPMRIKEGPLIKMTMVRQGRSLELEPLVEWAPSSTMRPGGPVYFNPSLRLQRGEIVVAVHKSGKMARLMVNAAFASVRVRQHRAFLASQPPARRTVYDRLMADDEFGDDDT